MTISVEQAQIDLARMLEQVAAGDEVVITRDGRPLARVTAVPQENGNSASSDAHTPGDPIGWGKGLITYIAPDFDAPLDDFKEYM